ncbi:energy transducer TonB [Aliiglaciecola sp. LCG003]|uniref:energy transducer TonB n=1 Tax=Aliiglaciecola sp. LCG003 TaxID=3053655 RepID=UPI0025746C97|nr:energy transducer TonB [Aliiglaciecola sp. LCG003]WJG09767.1 energy transducer TonB [Aliiglaciecola sp. LCG003]
MDNIMLAPQPRMSFKLPSFILIAAFITFALFVMMDKLTSQEGQYAEAVENTVFIDPVLDIEESGPIEQQKIKPLEPPKQIPEPLKPLIEEVPSDSALGLQVKVEIPQQQYNKADISLGSGGEDSRPLIRIAPRYPTDAARDGIEGWVELQFTIDASGRVKDIQVVDSHPKRTFDREARKALQKWKYKPQYVDGRAVDKPGMQVVLDFKLDA